VAEKCHPQEDFDATDLPPKRNRGVRDLQSLGAHVRDARSSTTERLSILKVAELRRDDLFVLDISSQHAHV
jgi:hypothetical protein